MEVSSIMSEILVLIGFSDVFYSNLKALLYIQKYNSKELYIHIYRHNY